MTTQDPETRLRNLLKKLFQFEHADLDFGIYRIMNQKRDQINKFIDHELIEAVDEALREYSIRTEEHVKKEIENLRMQIINTLGENAFLPTGDVKPEFRDTPLVREYEEKRRWLEEIETPKAEIFNHLYQFFSRYYQDGDFISLPRAKSGKYSYAIPYNGEEVVLYWANRDQYYIKTTEYFYNYTFEAEGYHIHFRIVEVSPSQDNDKNKKRFFVLADREDQFMFDPEKKELTIFFEYRELTPEETKILGEKQEKINEVLERKILENIENDQLKSILMRERRETENEQLKNSSTSKKEGKTLLGWHLFKYAKRNTSDYFIHKNLEGFLKRELDFYLKSEVLNLENIEEVLSERDIKLLLAKALAIKKIAYKIIEFLAQIENFQKMLWEKKKFVVRTEYCITLDKIPEEFYPEILENEAQIEEWKQLYNLEEFERLTNPIGYSSAGGLRIDLDYLKNHPHMMLDTKFFSQDFKDRLFNTLAKLGMDLDEETDGLLIKSENWQALNLLQEKYQEKVKCIYIDPPYNTWRNEFPFKDNYKHSSWITMMENRLEKSKRFLLKSGILFMSLDDNEFSGAMELLKELFGRDNYIGQFIWRNKAGGGGKQSHNIPGKGKTKREPFQIDHEYILTVGRDREQITRLNEPLSEEEKSQYKNPDNDPRGPYKLKDLEQSIPTPISTMYYVLEDPDGKKVKPKGGRFQWRFSKERALKQLKDGSIIWKKIKCSTDIDPRGYYYRPMVKQYLYILGEERTKIKRSIIYNIAYTRDGNKELSNLFNTYLKQEYPFINPKPIKLIKFLLEGFDLRTYIVMDFFAGSGTTAHAVINLNCEDGGKRKYILVEMADYFETVMKPRIQKVVFASEWKNGVPQNKDGVSHMFKYMYLEQYEDTLNNIEFVLPDGTTQRTFDDLEGYFIRYMLDFETRESPCRLNIKMMERPFEYTMRIVENGKIKEKVVVDLVETFNYLLGIHVEKILALKNNGHYYRVVYGGKGEEKEKIVVVWRNTNNLDLLEDKKFIENTVLKDIDLDSITLYVNGMCYVKGALPIEEKFKLLMGA